MDSEASAEKTPEEGREANFGDPSSATEDRPQRGWTAYAPLTGPLPPRPPGSREWRVLPQSPPTTVTFGPEYGVEVPLWPLADSTNELVPDDLLAKLISWQADFDANFHWETGWSSDEHKTRWAETAAGLETELRAALEGKAEVIVNLWPLEEL